MPSADVLIVSLGSTTGLRADVDELAGAMRRAGAAVAVASAQPPREVRTFVLTDLAWARAARAAAIAGIEEHAPRAILYHTITAALLWPRPGAIRFDAPAAANRPGRHGLWQRRVERRRLADAPLLVPVAEGTLAETPRPHAEALVVPIPVEPSGGRGRPPAVATSPIPVEPSRRPSSSSAAGASSPAKPSGGPGRSSAAGASSPAEPSGGPGRSSAAGAPIPGFLAGFPAERDIAAITYAANPEKKGLDHVLAGWRAHREGEELVVAGTDTPIDAPGARSVGRLEAAEYRALLRRARVFMCAPRREDYGIAQLEALADGCILVTTAAPGPYAALPLARALAPGLVVTHPGGLGAALRVALDVPMPDYAERAAELLAPFRRAAVDATVRDELLPRLLG